jgi:hypothetical protein
LAEWRRWSKREGSQQLRRLLLDEWDPVGVAGCAPDDEYDSYVGPVVSLARENDLKGLTEYLDWARTQNMGLDPDPEADERVARTVMKWHAEVSG